MADSENKSQLLEVESKVDDIKIESDVVTTATGPISKELQAQIIKQVEFYFGDVNLAKDKFLNEEIKKDDGWISLELLLTFKRMKKLTSDAKFVCAALDTSEEGLIQISEDRLKLRRHPERPLLEPNEETRKEIITRTAYVKGFSLESTMSELIEFFDEHEKVVNIVMLKYLEKPSMKYTFKGSVFVTFLKREQCEEFLNKENIEYKGVKLEKKWQDDPVRKINFPKGALLYFEGFSCKITRQMIKLTLFESDVDVAYVDYKDGSSNGYIRLSEENSSQSFVDNLENKKLKIKGEEACVRLVQGDEEEEYLAKQVQQITRGGNSNCLKKVNKRNRRQGRKRPAEEEEEW